MGNFIVNFCSAILLYLKIFKRRFLSIIGMGQQRRNTPPLLPQTLKSETQHQQQKDKHMAPPKEESWDTWTNDAKQELNSVKIVNHSDFIEERKIDNLFAAMAPVHQAVKSPAPILPLLKQQEPQLTATSSRFAVNDVYASKVCCPGSNYYVFTFTRRRNSMSGLKMRARMHGSKRILMSATLPQLKNAGSQLNVERDECENRRLVRQPPRNPRSWEPAHSIWQCGIPWIRRILLSHVVSGLVI
jgi:hypothetical protein